MSITQLQVDLLAAAIAKDNHQELLERYDTERHTDAMEFIDRKEGPGEYPLWTGSTPEEDDEKIRRRNAQQELNEEIARVQQAEEEEVRAFKRKIYKGAAIASPFVAMLGLYRGIKAAHRNQEKWRR